MYFGRFFYFEFSSVIVPIGTRDAQMKEAWVCILGHNCQASGHSIGVAVIFSVLDLINTNLPNQVICISIKRNSDIVYRPEGIGNH